MSISEGTEKGKKFVGQILALEVPQALAKLQGHLLTRAFICDFVVSKCDAAAAAHVAEAVIGMPQEERIRFNNVVRWLDSLRAVLKELPLAELQVQYHVPEAVVPKAGGKSKKDKKKKEKKGGGGKKEVPAVSRLEMLVGRVVSAEAHPTADALYVEQIDIGTDAPIQVVSGLVGKVPLEEFQDSLVVVVTNVKAGELQGVLSSGLVLLGTSADGEQFALLRPPTDAVPGDRVLVDGCEDAEPDRPNVSAKQLHKIKKKLASTAEGVPAFDGLPLRTAKGVCTLGNLAGATIA
ncbi:MAG: hypothetical protein MHM6MM_001669 [Cercozoa sp. M6MM]